MSILLATQILCFSVFKYLVIIQMTSQALERICQTRDATVGSTKTSLTDSEENAERCLLVSLTWVHLIFGEGTCGQVRRPKSLDVGHKCTIFNAHYCVSVLGLSSEYEMRSPQH